MRRGHWRPKCWAKFLKKFRVLKGQSMELSIVGRPFLPSDSNNQIDFLRSMKKENQKLNALKNAFLRWEKSKKIMTNHEQGQKPHELAKEKIGTKNDKLPGRRTHPVRGRKQNRENGKERGNGPMSRVKKWDFQKKL